KLVLSIVRSQTWLRSQSSNLAFELWCGTVSTLLVNHLPQTLTKVAPFRSKLLSLCYNNTTPEQLCVSYQDQTQRGTSFVSALGRAVLKDRVTQRSSSVVSLYTYSRCDKTAKVSTPLLVFTRILPFDVSLLGHNISQVCHNQPSLGEETPLDDLPRHQ